jgi:SNF2 family DNA or RNA helicase
MVGRTRADVGRELPHGEAIPIEQPVETDSKVLDKLAGNAVEMAHLILDQRTSPQERFRIENEFEMKMRQATGVAKAPFVASFIELLLASQNKVGVFLWHREVYDILMDRLEQYRPVMYSGSETPRQKNESFDAFVDGDARVLLMSLRSGAGLDGMQRVCSTAVHAEFDWSPMQHDQANGRFARDGQTEPVMAFYMVADEGSDPVMIELLNVKRNQAESIMHPGGKLIQPSAMSASDRVRMLAESYLKQRGHRVPAAAPRATARIVQPALL